MVGDIADAPAFGVAGLLPVNRSIACKNSSKSVSNGGNVVGSYRALEEFDSDRVGKVVGAAVV